MDQDNPPESIIPGLAPEPDSVDDAAGPGGRLGRAWHSAARIYRQRLPPSGPIPATDEVALDLRQHPVALLAPICRTLAGLLALTWPALLPILLFACTIAVWARRTLRTRPRGTLIAAGTAVLLVLLARFGSLRYGVLFLLVLLGWCAVDALQWREDRLVVTTKRIYRVYGLITKHAPSISLTGVAYIDTAVNPLGRLLHYGTLHLDSAAQEDAPLSSIRFIPDVPDVHVRILELRGKAMPKFPSTPP